MKIFFVVFFLLAIVGCAGVSMKPISSTEAQALHAESNSKTGYVVYEPMVVVEVSEQIICGGKDAEGKCNDPKIRCAAGTPFLLPDYKKPYLIDSKSGFGKAGTEITIIDGWKLGSVKDSSDNSNILGLIGKLGGVDIASSKGNENKTCTSAGLFKLSITSEKLELTRILPYIIDEDKSSGETVYK